MAVNVLIPTPLQQLAGNKPQVEVEATTIREMVEQLASSYPGIRERLCDDSGKLRRFMNVYVNGEDIRALQREETALKDGDEISLVPAIAGG